MKFLAAVLWIAGLILGAMFVPMSVIRSLPTWVFVLVGVATIVAIVSPALGTRRPPL